MPEPAGSLPERLLAVQWIRVHWTKRSRGGPAAARRTALPEAFPLPDAPRPFVHEVHCDERTDFAPHPSVTPGLPSDVELTEHDGLLHVRLAAGTPQEWASNGLDVPWRRSPVPLRPRQTLRWQINHRFGAERGWYYRQDTLNVVYGTPATDVFLHEPSRRVDERVRLY